MLKRPGYLILASAAFCLGCILLNGCSTGPDTSDEGLFPAKKGPTAVEVLKKIEYKETGTITGRVIYDGTPPAREKIAAIDIHADRSYCMRGDTGDQTWIVGSDGAVANVVVFVRVPKGFYLEKPDDKLKTWPDEVKVDQPFCQFEPHVVVLYPQYYDGAQYVKTGQYLKVLNSAEIGHNIKVAGTGDINPLRGAQLSAKTGQYLFDTIKVDKRELTMNCDVHKWMAGYALTFDHPYAAVTKPDGTFTIKNVPAGVELVIKGWHEDLKQFDPTAGSTKITLKPGETHTLNFSVKKR